MFFVIIIVVDVFYFLSFPFLSLPSPYIGPLTTQLRLPLRLRAWFFRYGNGLEQP